MADPLAILLISGSYERAHYAFMLATAGAAIGRPVTLFATNEGAHALARDWSALSGAERDAQFRTRGAAGFDELRDAAVELGVQLLACETGLLIASLELAALLPAVEVSGLPAFLASVKHASFTL